MGIELISCNYDLLIPSVILFLFFFSPVCTILVGSYGR